MRPPGTVACKECGVRGRVNPIDPAGRTHDQTSRCENTACPGRKTRKGQLFKPYLVAPSTWVRCGGCKQMNVEAERPSLGVVANCDCGIPLELIYADGRIREGQPVHFGNTYAGPKPRGFNTRSELRDLGRQAGLPWGGGEKLCRRWHLGLFVAGGDTFAARTISSGRPIFESDLDPDWYRMEQDNIDEGQRIMGLRDR